MSQRIYIYILYLNLKGAKTIRTLQSRWLQLSARLILGCLFIYASINKIAFPGEFARVVENYRMLPSFAVKSVAIFLPWSELILGVFLVAGFLIKESALILTALLIIFTIAIGIRITTGSIEDCGCFDRTSLLSTSNNAVIILRDFIFISLGIFILLLNKKKC